MKVCFWRLPVAGVMAEEGGGGRGMGQGKEGKKGEDPVPGDPFSFFFHSFQSIPGFGLPLVLFSSSFFVLYTTGGIDRVGLLLVMFRISMWCGGYSPGYSYLLLFFHFFVFFFQGSPIPARCQ